MPFWKSSQASQNSQLSPQNSILWFYLWKLRNCILKLLGQQKIAKLIPNGILIVDAEFFSPQVQNFPPSVPLMGKWSLWTAIVLAPQHQHLWQPPSQSGLNLIPNNPLLWCLATACFGSVSFLCPPCNLLGQSVEQWEPGWSGNIGCRAVANLPVLARTSESA